MKYVYDFPIFLSGGAIRGACETLETDFDLNAGVEEVFATRRPFDDSDLQGRERDSCCTAETR
jgi:hypothetical protein